MHTATGQSGFTDFTSIVVYKSNVADRDIRPFGLGSASSLNPFGSSVPHFNLGCDPSIRKDNGSITGYTQAHPTNQVFVRTSVFDTSRGGLIRDYFDGVEVLLTSDNYYAVNSGDLFIGDVRNSAIAGELSVAEVILFDRGLTPLEVASVQEYLVANIATPRPAPRGPIPPIDPPPGTSSLTSTPLTSS
jgi:hypothetical protein